MRTSKEPSPEEKAVGLVLRQLRQAHGLTTTVVAYRLGMSEQNYRHYESGRNQLSLLQIGDFAWALEEDPRKLFEDVRHYFVGSGIIRRSRPQKTPGMTPAAR